MDASFPLKLFKELVATRLCATDPQVPLTGAALALHVLEWTEDKGYHPLRLLGSLPASLRPPAAKDGSAKDAATAVADAGEGKEEDEGGWEVVKGGGKTGGKATQEEGTVWTTACSHETMLLSL